jgi:hypothetical protein
MKKITLVATVLLLSACVMKQKVMDVAVVSGTHTSIPAGSKLQDIGPVTGQFCTSNNDKGSVGLFDEAIKNAQTNSKADFIASASFFREGSCVSIEGTGQKLVDNGGNSTPAPEKKTTKRR